MLPHIIQKTPFLALFHPSFLLSICPAGSWTHGMPKGPTRQQNCKKFDTEA